MLLNDINEACVVAKSQTEEEQQEGLKEPQLSSVSAEQLDNWRSFIEKLSLSHDTFYLVSDTETSHTQIYDEQNKEFNRVLEWSLILCVADERGLLSPVFDEHGNRIVIDEPINPFIEPRKNKRQQSSIKNITEESTRVHGLTLEYLFGKPCPLKSDKPRKQLEHSAPYFEMVFFALQRLFNFSAYYHNDISVHLLFHNASFDVGFLNSEMEMNEHPPIESYFIPLDTLRLARRIIPADILPDGYTLDSLFSFGKSRYPDLVKEVERPYHSSLIDSNILIHVWNTIRLYQAEKSESIELPTDPEEETETLDNNDVQNND